MISDTKVEALISSCLKNVIFCGLFTFENNNDNKNQYISMPLCDQLDLSKFTRVDLRTLGDGNCVRQE